MHPRRRLLREKHELVTKGAVLILCGVEPGKEWWLVQKSIWAWAKTHGFKTFSEYDPKENLLLIVRRP